MKETTKYVSRDAMRDALDSCKTSFGAWLQMVNDGELRARRLRTKGKALWAYELEQAVRFMARHTFKFDRDAEQRLRVSSFELV